MEIGSGQSRGLVVRFCSGFSAPSGFQGQSLRELLTWTFMYAWATRSPFARIQKSPDVSLCERGGIVKRFLDGSGYMCVTFRTEVGFMEKNDSFLRTWMRYAGILFFLGACAGTQRNCSSCSASQFGSDWVVVQLDLNGNPFRCWALRNTSIANEAQSDGIYWLDGTTGNLVHISGLYNRVQVEGGNWDHAYRELGLTEDTCEEIHDRMWTPDPSH